MANRRRSWAGACFAVLGLLTTQGSSYAEPAPESDRSKIAFAFGYSSFFLAPHAAVNLSGAASEVRWDFGSRPHSLFSKPFSKTHQLTFSAATVLRGGITADALALTYGRAYEFQRVFLGIGFAPFTYILFLRGDGAVAPDYLLEGGPRFAAYGHLGWRPFITEGLRLTVEAKYTFTVKNVYWHNPFAPHVHRDLFNSLVLGLGVQLAPR